MQQTATYSVVLSGRIKPGFEAADVIEKFASLFKLPPEKAEKLVGTRFVIKKEVDLKLAKKYKDRLSTIGIEVTLKRHGGIDAMALEPVAEKEPAAEQQAEAEQAPAAARPSIPNGMICPKCNLEQVKADQCSGCGVFVQKFLQAQVAKQASAAVPQDSLVAGEESPIDDNIKPTWKYLLAPAAAAVAGALLWYMLSAVLNYEFGLVAWAIGGAVGYTALASGARGDAAGIACAILVVLSIFGGKFMAASSMQAELLQEIQGLGFDNSSVEQLYEIDLADARDFAALDGSDESLRQFLYTHDYSATEQVTQAEIEEFMIYTQPRFHFIIDENPSYEEWLQLQVVDQIENYSTLDIVTESLGWMDLLFLFFGVGTAYRLASQGRGQD